MFHFSTPIHASVVNTTQCLKKDGHCKSDEYIFLYIHIFCHTFQTKSWLLSAKRKRTSIKNNQNLCIICWLLRLYSWLLPNIQETQLSRIIHFWTKIFHTAHQHAIVQLSSIALFQKRELAKFLRFSWILHGLSCEEKRSVILMSQI